MNPNFFARASAQQGQNLNMPSDPDAFLGPSMQANGQMMPRGGAPQNRNNFGRPLHPSGSQQASYVPNMTASTPQQQAFTATNSWGMQPRPDMANDCFDHLLMTPPAETTPYLLPQNQNNMSANQGMRNAQSQQQAQNMHGTAQFSVRNNSTARAGNASSQEPQHMFTLPNKQAQHSYSMGTGLQSPVSRSSSSPGQGDGAPSPHQQTQQSPHGQSQGQQYSSRSANAAAELQRYTQQLHNAMRRTPTTASSVSNAPFMPVTGQTNSQHAQVRRISSPNVNSPLRTVQSIPQGAQQGHLQTPIASQVRRPSQQHPNAAQTVNQARTQTPIATRPQNGAPIYTNLANGSPSRRSAAQAAQAALQRVNHAPSQVPPGISNLRGQQTPQRLVPGTKRTLPESANGNAQAAKRQATSAQNVVNGASANSPMVDPKAAFAAEKAKHARMMELKRQTDEQAKQRQNYAQMMEQRRLADEAAKKKEAERKAREQQQLAQQQQAYVEQMRLQNEQAERERHAAEQRLEDERKRVRKLQLRTDESALYRHYNEYLTFWPLGYKEGRNPYLNNLLANRTLPMDATSDLAMAITFAKENWRCYYMYPKDTERCAKWQREKLEKDKQTEVRSAGNGRK